LLSALVLTTFTVEPSLAIDKSDDAVGSVLMETAASPILMVLDETNNDLHFISTDPKS
jgi:hypothetical protein